MDRLRVKQIDADRRRPICHINCSKLDQAGVSGPFKTFCQLGPKGL